MNCQDFVHFRTDHPFRRFWVNSPECPEFLSRLIQFIDDAMRHEENPFIHSMFSGFSVARGYLHEHLLLTPWVSSCITALWQWVFSSGPTE